MHSLERKLADTNPADLVEIDGYIAVNEAKYDIRSLTTSVGFLLHASYLQLRELLRTKDEFELKPAMFELLRIASENPGIRQAHAAKILLIQESNMATMVKDLSKEGLVKRGSKSPGLWLTDAGRQRLERAAKLARSIERAYTVDLSEAEDQALRALLSKVYQASLRRKIAAEALADNQHG